MITVRFPSGFSIQYNGGGYVSQDGNFSFRRIYPSKADATANRNIIAWVPQDTIVEFAAPCRIYNADGPSAETSAEIRDLRKKIESLTRAVNKGKK